MLHYVPGYGFQSARTLQYLKLCGILVLQFPALCIRMQVGIDDLCKIVREGGVLILHLWQMVAVCHAHRCLVLHGLQEVIFRNRCTKPLVRQFLAAEQRSARKRHKLSIRQTNTEVLRQTLVLRAVCLVYEHYDVTTVREQRVFLPLVIAKLLYQRKEYLVVLAKHLAKLSAILRTAVFRLLHEIAIQEVAVYLVVKVFTVGHYQEGIVTRELTVNLPCEEYHGETLARTLRMPEHTHLALVLLLHVRTHHILEPLNGIVHTKELMVLRTYLVALVIHDEVLHIVKQTPLLQQAEQQIVKASACCLNLILELKSEVLAILLSQPRLEESP